MEAVLYCYRDVAMTIAVADYIDPKYRATIYKRIRENVFRNEHKLSVVSLPGNRDQL